MNIEKLVITLETVNDAFGETTYETKMEIARILRTYADKLEDNLSPRVLRDINGNKVGSVEYNK